MKYLRVVLNNQARLYLLAALMPPHASCSPPSTPPAGRSYETRSSEVLLSLLRTAQSRADPGVALKVMRVAALPGCSPTGAHYSAAIGACARVGAAGPLMRPTACTAQNTLATDTPPASHGGSADSAEAIRCVRWAHIFTQCDLR